MHSYNFEHGGTTWPRKQIIPLKTTAGAKGVSPRLSSHSREFSVDSDGLISPWDSYSRDRSVSKPQGLSEPNSAAEWKEISTTEGDTSDLLRYVGAVSATTTDEQISLGWNNEGGDSGLSDENSSLTDDSLQLVALKRATLQQQMEDELEEELLLQRHSAELVRVEDIPSDAKMRQRAQHQPTSHENSLGINHTFLDEQRRLMEASPALGCYTPLDNSALTTSLVNTDTEDRADDDDARSMTSSGEDVEMVSLPPASNLSMVTTETLRELRSTQSTILHKLRALEGQLTVQAEGARRHRQEGMTQQSPETATKKVEQVSSPSPARQRSQPSTAERAAMRRRRWQAHQREMHNARAREEWRTPVMAENSQRQRRTLEDNSIEALERELRAVENSYAEEASDNTDSSAEDNNNNSSDYNNNFSFPSFQPGSDTLVSYPSDEEELLPVASLTESDADVNLALPAEDAPYSLSTEVSWTEQLPATRVGADNDHQDEEEDDSSAPLDVSVPFSILAAQDPGVMGRLGVHNKLMLRQVDDLLRKDASQTVPLLNDPQYYALCHLRQNLFDQQTRIRPSLRSLRQTAPGMQQSVTSVADTSGPTAVDSSFESASRNVSRSFSESQPLQSAAREPDNSIDRKSVV